MEVLARQAKTATIALFALYFRLYFKFASFFKSLCSWRQNLPVIDAAANSCCIWLTTARVEALLHKRRRHNTHITPPENSAPLAGVQISGFEICYQICDNRFATSPPRAVKEIIGDVHV